MTALPLVAVVAAAPAATTFTTAAQLASAVAGACVLIAAVLFYLQWRVRPVSRQGWLVAVTVLLAHQLLVASVLAFATSSTDHTWPLALDTVTTVLALTIIVVVLREDALHCPDPLALGLGVGTALAAARLVPPQVGLPIDVPVMVLGGVIVLGHVALAVIALKYSQLPRWVARAG
ncbi:MAG: hypothetical protein LT071_09230 [Nocardioides sp.]|nr:hypothetical protein [Nocardioides sp.]